MSHEHEKLFDQFWAAYPVKKGKGQALKTWNKIKPDQSLLAIMLRSIDEQKMEKYLLTKAEEFCPHWKYPSTWLNSKCWEDEKLEVMDKKETGSRPNWQAYKLYERKKPVDAATKARDKRAAEFNIKYIRENLL